MKICVLSPFSHSFLELKARLNASVVLYHWQVVRFRANVPWRGKTVRVLEEFVNFLRLMLALKLYSKEWVIVADAYHVSTLFFGKWLTFLGRRKKIYCFNLFVQRLYGNFLAKRVLRFLLGKDVALAIYSENDFRYFKELNPLLDVRYIPWSGSLTTEVADSLVADNGYVFSGGTSNRDYDFLVRCARLVPGLAFEIVCSRVNTISQPLSANIRVRHDIPQNEFHDIMAGSRAVVIPLKENIGSSGQMVSIASMSLGKTTVFPDFPSVSQYFEDGTTGLMYRGGDEDSLVSILKLVKSDSKRCSEIGREAYTSWDRKFNGDRFAGAVIDHIKDFFWSAR